MNRRSFFKKLGIGAATIALAPTVLEEVARPEVARPEVARPEVARPEVVNATLGEYTTYYSTGVVQDPFPRILAQYSDFSNFSDMLVDSPIDAEIVEAAKTLGDAHAERIRRLTTFNYNVHQVDYHA